VITFDVKGDGIFCVRSTVIEVAQRKRVKYEANVGVLGGGEAILHAVNRLIKDRGDGVSLLMLLVDFINAFNLVDREVMLQEVRTRCLAISRWVEFCYSTPTISYYGEHTLRSYQGVQQGDPFGPLLFSLVLHPLVSKIRDSFNISFQAWYLDYGIVIKDTLVVGEVLKVIMEDGPHRSLHLNVDITNGFWPKEDQRSRFVSVFPPNIASPLHGVKLLGGPASENFDFSSELVMKRVTKYIVLMDTIAKLIDPQCELLLLRACLCISKLYFSMCTCSPHVFEQAQRSFDAALRSSLERIIRDLVIGSGGSPPYPLHLEGLVSTPQSTNRFMEVSNRGTYFRLAQGSSDLWDGTDYERNIYGDHVVSCTVGKEVDIELSGGQEKPLCPADMLLYSWDEEYGLDKGYGRFQRLLSLFKIHGAGVSTKDANQIFLRSLPSAWSNISLIMRNKPSIDTLDIDDLYNNLKVYEAYIKGSSGSSSNLQNVAFVSAESTGSTNELNGIADQPGIQGTKVEMPGMQNTE
nr:hypothetical protein [Tanacetum cinerariifolium]